MAMLRRKMGFGLMALMLVLSLCANLLLIAPLNSYAAGELTVQYRVGDSNAQDNQIKPQFKIVNSGTTPVSLSDLKLRYYYTIDGEQAQQFSCDWAQLGCSNVSGSFAKIGTPTTGADYYLEVSFGSGAGTLAPGSQSGEIQTRINKVNWSNYNETNDYSYIGTQTSYAANNKVTLYRNGALVYGIEPAGSSEPTNPTIPVAPIGVTATGGNGSVTLNWTASSGATSYTVKRATTNGGPYTTVATGVTATSYTNAGVTNGMTYYYVISASNSAGESANSTQTLATPSANTVPVVPAAPTGVMAMSGNAQITIHWTASSGAVSYTIKRSSTNGGPYTTVATGVTATSYTNTNLTNGTTYYYVVSAVNSAGSSVNSLQVSAIPVGTPSNTTISGDTTIATLCSNYKEIYLDRTFLDYLPGDGSGGHSDHSSDSWMSDSAKSSMYGFNVSAVQSKIGNGTLKLSELGTQALGHVERLDALSFPRDGICKLLPRLALLDSATEAATYHVAATPWAETSGTINASNNPTRFIQQLWPSDARTYQPAEKAERDRIHDQPVHENNVGWTFTGSVGPEILKDKTNPILNAIKNKVNPVTGKSLGGNSFTSNAPMSAVAKMHVQNSGFWYQVLEFKNTSDVPYFLDGAVIWWVGPSGMAYDLRNGHYNNSQRPGPGYGHPQRDIIEVVYDEQKQLSAYVIRLAFHDEPYNMRTSYPNQYWSLEVGTPAQVNGQQRFTTTQQRQEIVDLMASTLHVELETNLDRNIDLLNALKLRNRVSN